MIDCWTYVEDCREHQQEKPLTEAEYWELIEEIGMLGLQWTSGGK